MTQYVVRSMTTTDYDPRSGKPVTPYHIYLMPSHKRARAYWSSKHEAQTFATPQEAEAEIARSLHNWDGGPDTKSQIVPYDDTNVPAYWELRAGL